MFRALRETKLTRISQCCQSSQCDWQKEKRCDNGKKEYDAICKGEEMQLGADSTEAVKGDVR